MYYIFYFLEGDPDPLIAGPFDQGEVVAEWDMTRSEQRYILYKSFDDSMTTMSIEELLES